MGASTGEHAGDGAGESTVATTAAPSFVSNRRRVVLVRDAIAQWVSSVSAG